MGDEHNQWLAGLGIEASVLDLVAEVTGATPAASPVGASAPPAGANPDADYSNGVVERLVKKIKAGGDMAFDIAMLSNMEMKTLLDVMQGLKKAGCLDELAVPAEKRRIGAAMLTVRPDLELAWQGLVSGLNDADRAAILERVPPEARAKIGGGKADPGGGSGGGGGKDPGDSGVDTDAVISVGPQGAEVQANLTFHSGANWNLGETQFTIHIGPNGKLSQFEVDVTAIKQKLDKMGVISSMLDIDATLSLNSTVDLDQQATKVIFGKVQGQLKGEIQANLKQVKALKNVHFKLTATAGSGGVSVTGSIEFPIPGT